MLTRLNIANVRSERLAERAIEARSQSLENPSIPLSNPTPALLEALGIGPSTTGITVTERKAMTLSAVYACVRILAESLASLPLVTYERLARGKHRAINHPVYQLLHNRPNPEMTPFQFIETMQGHVALTGNAFAEIEWNGRNQPINLWPITPDRVRVERVGGEKRYIVSLPTGTPVALARENVLHIPGFGYDGLIGYSPIGLMKQTVSVGMAAEEYGARFYGNGSKPGGVLTTGPGQKLSPQAKEQLKKSWEQMQGGLSNAHRVALLEEGMTWKQITINPDDAQFLETRNFQVTEICRMFRVPPHMVAQLDKATFSNIEQQSIDFVTNTLRPWAVRWEQAVSYDLFSNFAGNQFFAEFVMDALLRGDTTARYAAYNIGRNGGWLSANDIREMENLNPLPGDEGDLYLVPLNMVPADQVARADEAGETPADEADEDDTADDADDTAAEGERSRPVALWRAALAPVFGDAAERVARRETVARERAEKRGVAFVDALDHDHEAAIARIFAPAMRALVTLVGTTLSEAVRAAAADRLSAQHAERHMAAVRAGSQPSDALADVFARIESFFPTPIKKRIAA
jgi:HK97 family phage portal protein